METKYTCPPEQYEAYEEAEKYPNMPPLTPANLKRQRELEAGRYSTVLANADSGYSSYCNE